MTSIGSVSSGSSNWPVDRQDHAARMKQRLFEKTDADGSGTVDTDELKALLTQAAERTGQDLGDAATVLKQMDGNGDGSLDSDELDSGMKQLMPPPPSTVDFAQQHGDARSLQSALQQLMKAVDGDQDQSISDSEAQRFTDVLSQALNEDGGDAAAAAQGGNDAQRLTALITRMLAQYQAGTGGSTSTGSVDLSV